MGIGVWSPEDHPKGRKCELVSPTANLKVVFLYGMVGNPLDKICSEVHFAHWCFQVMWFTLAELKVVLGSEILDSTGCSWQSQSIGGQLAPGFHNGEWDSVYALKELLANSRGDQNVCSIFISTQGKMHSVLHDWTKCYRSTEVEKTYSEWEFGKAPGRDDIILPGLNDYYELNVSP